MKKPNARRSKQDWIHAALEALRDEGVEGVRVEPLAVRLGVTKGSFYWHFETREQLLTAALDSWVARGTEAIIEHVDGVQAGPAAKLRELWRRTVTDASGDLSIEHSRARQPAVPCGDEVVADEQRIQRQAARDRELLAQAELAEQLGQVAHAAFVDCAHALAHAVVALRQIANRQLDA